jgi:hypothetical protein
MQRRHAAALQKRGNVRLLAEETQETVPQRLLQSRNHGADFLRPSGYNRVAAVGAYLLLLEDYAAV